jgi:enamine deaminase RidA (YjgF/YER057c/UK114 family)
MERIYLEPAGLAPPPEPYAHAIRCGDTVYIAGQVAFDEDAAGGAVADVVKITVFLKDIRDAPAELAARERLFEPGRFPICTMVQVANLGLPDLLMEVDAVAVLPRGGQERKETA